MSILKQLIFTPKCSICSRLGITFCPSCIKGVTPFRAKDLSEINACYCAGEYSGWLRESLICYKNGDSKYVEVLSQVLFSTLDKFLGVKNLTLIPIPSSPQKVKDRGFDSIAKLCSELIQRDKSLTMDQSNLYLRRTVLDQVGLTAAQRHSNLEGAFGIRRTVNGTFVLVDDVVTTGATLNSAARILKFAGAQRVFAVTLCGSPKSR